MTADEILAELATLGSESTKKTLLRHGAKEPFFGVKIEHLKKIQKRIKKDQALALALYDTGNSDAMYLAGLLCDPAKMKKSDLQRWVKKAPWSMISDYTVAWAAAESPHALELAREWIDSSKENIACSGWNTFSGVVALVPDEELDLTELADLLGRVASNLPKAPNRVRYTMNGFVIAVGSYVIPLVDLAKKTADQLGKVEVNMGDTACKVPLAREYIEKIEKMGRLGKKRKTVFC